MKAPTLNNRFSCPGIKGKSDMDLAKFRKGCYRNVTGTDHLNTRQTIKHNTRELQKTWHSLLVGLGAPGKIWELYAK